MSYVVQIIFFFFSALLAFYLPGRVLLGKQKQLSWFAVAVLAITVGIVAWGWQGYIFGYLHVRWMSYVYLGIFLFLFIRQTYYPTSFLSIKKLYKDIDWVAFFISLVGVFSFTLVYLRMGQQTPEGLFLMRYNLVDHVWHATLVNEIVHRFPPNEPGLYGVVLTNYHYWFNLVTAELIRVFHLPLFQTQFAGMYVLCAILFACLVYLLAKAIYPSKMFIYLALFFLLFAGDIANWVTLLLKNSFFIYVHSLATEATKLIDSPARGMSVVVALAAIYLVVIYRKQWNKRGIFLTGLLFGSLMGFKVYTGIPFLIGLGCFSLYSLLKKRSEPVAVGVIAIFLASIQFFPTNYNSGGLVFLLADVPRDFIAQKAFGLSYVDQRWRIYLEHNNYPRIIEYAFLMSAFYFVVQFGIKIFGLYPLRKTRELLRTDLLVLLYGALFSSLFLGLFFYQKVGGANIFEFFLTSVILLGFLVALNIATLFEKLNKKIVIVLTSLIIVISLPAWVISVQGYVNDVFFSGFHGVTNNELAAFNFIKNNTAKNAVILIANTDRFEDYSSLTSVLMDRPLFLSGGGVSGHVSAIMAERRKEKKLIQTSRDPRIINTILEKNAMQYLFFYGKPKLNVDINKLSIKKVFSNDAATIYEVIH